MAKFLLPLVSSLLVQRSLMAAASEAITPMAPPPPPISHVTLDDDFISKFDQVVVIGDIHGCFDELDQLLKLIHNDTNEESVLKIFVGDLVNKGPKNREVLQYFLQDKDKNVSTCLAVRGNHDEIVIREYITEKKHPGYLRPSNKWMKQLTDQEVDYLISLPYTYTLPSLNSIIVHAGLIPGVELKDQKSKTLTTVRNLIENEDGTFTGTKKHKPGTAWAQLWTGPSHVYFGHDAKRRLQVCDYATGLDTGCVYGDRLTGFFLKGSRKGEFVEVKAFECHQPVDEEN